MPNPDPLAQSIRMILDGRTDITVATAESCTGGMIAARLTSVPGSSGYVLGGIVAYANTIKQHLLGVPPEILGSRGAVSEECAAAMASGARDRLGATHAVSTTGIAGPDGGTERKPVGLVYIGIATPEGVQVERHVFPGDRHDIITAATNRGLTMLLNAIAQA